VAVFVFVRSAGIEPATLSLKVNVEWSFSKIGLSNKGKMEI